MRTTRTTRIDHGELTRMQPNELAQMRAEMLMRQDPNVYDDGASQLGMSPYMQQVGLFGKGKPKPVAPPIDIQRRSILGLKPQAPLPDNLPAVRSSNVPVPNAVPVPSQGPHPDVWAGGSFATNADFGNVIKKHLEDRRAENASQSTNPLTQMANKALNTPVSRREVLKKAGQVALNQALPTPKVTDVVPEIVSPLAQAAESAFTKNGNIDFHLGDYMHHAFSDAYEQEPQAVAQSAWLLARNYLKDRISKEKLDQMDTLANTPNGEYEKYSSDDRSNKDAHELYIHMQHQLTRNLKPHEMVDVLSNLHQHDYDPNELYSHMAEFYQYDPRSYEPKFAELGLKPKQADRSFEFQSLVKPEEFKEYLDQSWKQSQKDKKASESKE